MQLSTFAADRLLVVRPPNYYAGGLDIFRHEWETVYTYDTRGLVLTKTTPDTRNTAGSGPGTFRYTYDTSGRLRYSQDPEQRALGHVAYIRYDAMDRPVYSGVGRPVICDPDGTGDPETCWSQLVPDGGTNWPDVLDPTGTRWDWLGDNRRTQYAYDAQAIGGWPYSGDTLAVRNYTAGRPAAVAHRIEGLWESTSRWQTTQYSYNAQGLVGERRERIRASIGTPWDLFTYTYNRAGMLTQDRVTVGSHTLRHQYGYDRRGLLATVGISHATTGSFSPILALTYDIAGAVTERHLGTGTGQTSVPYAYDVAGRIHEIGDVTSTSDPFAALYSYTPSGLIEVMEVRSPSAAQACLAADYWEYACADRWRYTFAYDELARLSTATYAGLAGGSWITIPFYDLDNVSYDRQGNLLGLRRWQPTEFSAEQVDNLTYSYTPRTNRLANVADAVTTDLDWDAKPSTFQYNRVGSMTRMTEALGPGLSRITDVQVYDERQLPEELHIATHAFPTSDTLFVRYRYDANGQRISKWVSGSGQTERYVRDGMRLIGVFDENDNLKSWNLGGIAGLVGRADRDPMAFEPLHRYYVTDHLGSIRAVVNASGTVIEGRDYYPYGLTMPGRFYVQADTTREGFTGHELDKETGDYYAGARFYGPTLGRWFVVDPMADEYPGWSPYNYTMGNPVTFIDPDGMEADDDIDQLSAPKSTEDFFPEGMFVYGMRNHRGARAPIVRVWMDGPSDQGTAATGGDPPVTSACVGLTCNEQTTKSWFSSPEASAISTTTGALQIGLGAHLDQAARGGYSKPGQLATTAHWTDYRRRGLIPRSHTTRLYGRVDVPTTSLYRASTVLKLSGRVFTAGSIISTGVQYHQGEIGGREAALDTIFTGAAFIPKVGWAASASYFLIGKPIYNRLFRNQDD